MLTEQDVVSRLRAAIVEAGGQRAFARRHGFTPAYVNDMLRGRRAVAEKVLDALGIERVTIHRVEYRARTC
jgi:DNA-binding transcriptional regulator YdaS (Cro superfamily)